MRTKSNFDVLFLNIFYVEALSDRLSLGKDHTLCRFSCLKQSQEPSMYFTYKQELF